MVELAKREYSINVECCEIPECSVEVTVPGGAVAHCVDYCIVPELKKLWKHGVCTICSCCGHGDVDAAYIRVDALSADKMRELGYVQYEPHECIFHSGSVSFRAIDVENEMEKGGPIEKGNINEIRERWKKAAGIGGTKHV